jgi:hypothetical protein
MRILHAIVGERLSRIAPCGLSTMRRVVTLIAAVSLTLAGAILSYIEAEAAHHVPTRLVMLADFRSAFCGRLASREIYRQAAPWPRRRVAAEGSRSDSSHSPIRTNITSSASPRWIVIALSSPSPRVQQNPPTTTLVRRLQGTRRQRGSSHK